MNKSIHANTFSFLKTGKIQLKIQENGCHFKECINIRIGSVNKIKDINTLTWEQLFDPQYHNTQVNKLSLSSSFRFCSMRIELNYLKFKPTYKQLIAAT